MQRGRVFPEEKKKQKSQRKLKSKNERTFVPKQCKCNMQHTYIQPFTLLLSAVFVSGTYSKYFSFGLVCMMLGTPASVTQTTGASPDASHATMCFQWVSEILFGRSLYSSLFNTHYIRNNEWGNEGAVSNTANVHLLAVLELYIV